MSNGLASCVVKANNAHRWAMVAVVATLFFATPLGLVFGAVSLRYAGAAKRDPGASETETRKAGVATLIALVCMALSVPLLFLWFWIGTGLLWTTH